MVAHMCARLYKTGMCMSGLAGSSVNYTFIISNPGNVMVRNVTIVAPGVGPLTCNGTAPAGIPPIHNMSVDEQVVCR